MDDYHSASESDAKTRPIQTRTSLREFGSGHYTPAHLLFAAVESKFIFSCGVHREGCERRNRAESPANGRGLHSANNPAYSRLSDGGYSHWSE